jgi:hypothetical protein
VIGVVMTSCAVVRAAHTMVPTMSLRNISYFSTDTGIVNDAVLTVPLR